MRVLISGGGIAGLAAAFWLERQGVEAVVIEKAAGFSALGHYIALKAGGVDVVRQMGLLERCRARETFVHRMRYLTSRGKLLRENSPSEYERTLGGYILFRRSDLHAALHEAVRDRVEIRYATRLVGIGNGPDGVDVTFADGRRESFELLLGADGVHSATRRLVFGEGHETPMGGRYFALTADYSHRMEVGCGSLYMGRGKQVGLGPTSDHSVSALVYYGDDGRQPDGESSSAIRDFLFDAFRDFAAPVRDVFAAIDDKAFVFMDRIHMIRMPAVVRGRVALLGDAGLCPTFLSGMGSALALQSAQCLASCLQQQPSLSLGLAEYQQRILPIARGYQASARLTRPVILGRGLFPNAMRDLVVRFAPTSLMRRKAQQFYRARAAT